MATRFDMKKQPRLRGIGLRAGSSAGKTERFQRGRTQGARFQHDLRQQAADTRLREEAMVQAAEEAEAGRTFTAEQSKLSRDFTAGENVLGRDAATAAATLGREHDVTMAGAARDFRGEQARQSRAQETDLFDRGMKSRVEQAQLARKAGDERAEYALDVKEGMQKRDLATRRDIARADIGVRLGLAAQKNRGGGLSKSDSAQAGKLESEVISLQSQIAKLDPEADADKIDRLIKRSLELNRRVRAYRLPTPGR